MQVAIFAAVPEEVGILADKVNFTGIGRENATQAALRFWDKYRNEEFTVLNIGTVGSHAFPVGTILSIDEIASAGMAFYDKRMSLNKWHAPMLQQIPTATLYSSDSFVSPSVYTSQYLDEVKSRVGCFDMESSALYSVMEHYGKKYVSFKIVSDNLNVTIEVWKQRVVELSKSLAAFVEQLFMEMGQNEEIEFLTL